MNNLFGKTLVLIDGSNVFYACKGLGVRIDWRKFRDFYRSKYNVLRFMYYTAVHVGEDGHNQLKPLLDYLSFNGFNCVLKDSKIYKGANGEDRIKGNMDIELVTDMLSYVGVIENVILFSGDNDFRYAVEAVQKKGVYVQVCSTLKSSPPMCGDDLRRQCDEFVEFADMIGQFEMLRAESVVA